MADGVTVDANVMKKFNRDFLAHEDSSLTILIEQTLTLHGIVIDIGDKVQHEWFTQCPSALFKEWFVQNMKLGRIRMVKPFIAEQHKRELLTKLGFPKRGYDLTYVAVANVTQKRYIVTEDIDFFDPTKKHAENQTKEKIKRERSGPVCRYLRREMGIVVGTPPQALIELILGKEVAAQQGEEGPPAS